MKYFIYARKSSESEDRQVQSLEDQVDHLQKIAFSSNLNIIDIYTESKSAKEPNNRPKFIEMLQRIECGEADAILCWQINRLSRNPVDSGQLQWLLQKNILKEIQTYDRKYLPSDNALLFSVESGMANQYIIDLKINTRRGMQSKLNKGWLPCLPPLGYLNDKETKTIIKDPDRFVLVRKMWELMLQGSYTLPQILAMANDEWGLRTRQMKRIGGKKIAKSTIYKMFNNLFYTGMIDYNGKLYQGEHEPMITTDEFEYVQKLMKKTGKNKPHRQEFSYTGLIRCGECGCLITAETKTKHLRKNDVDKNYTYYHCTKRRSDVKCSQKTNLPLAKLEEQIDELLQSITIMPQFAQWAIEVVNRLNDQEVTDRNKIYDNLHRELTELRSNRGRLMQLVYKGLITEDEFTLDRDLINDDIVKLENKIREVETNENNWFKLCLKTFNFTSYARTAFSEGDLKTKKEIFMAIGNNPVLENGKLSVQLSPWFQEIADFEAKQKSIVLTLEPTATPVNKRKSTKTQKLVATTPKSGLEPAETLGNNDLEAIQATENQHWYRRPESNRHGIAPTGF